LFFLLHLFDLPKILLLPLILLEFKLLNLHIYNIKKKIINIVVKEKTL
jgi:hypothetical protein